MKRFVFILIFTKISLFACDTDTLYIFGTKLENGGALFKGADSISLGVIRNNNYEQISDEIDVINIPFYESGVAAGAGTVNVTNFKNLQLWIRAKKDSEYWYITYINWPSLECPTLENPNYEIDFTISENINANSILFHPMGNTAEILENDGIDNRGLSFNFTLSNTDTDSDGLLDSVETNTGVFISAENTGTDPLVSDTDKDGINDGDEVNKHNSNPLDSDSDNDGVDDYVEIYLNRLNFDVSEDSSLLLDIIERAGFVRATEISTNDGLTLDEIVDLRPGSTMIEIHNEQAIISMEVEQSEDLNNWTSGSSSTLQIPIDVEAGKKFFRFKMSE